MADEQNNTQAQGSANAQTPTAGQNGTQQQDEQGQTQQTQQQPGPVPYERFQQVIQQKNQAEAEKKALETALAQALAALGGTQSQGDGEQGQQDGEQAEQTPQATDPLALLQATVRQVQVENLRLKVAVETGLPMELAERLRGEDEEALRADAQQLLTLLNAKPATPGVPPPTQGGQAANADLASMTPEQVREWAKKHGWG